MIDKELAIITGGALGIGAKLAKLLIEKNIQTVIIDKNSKLIEENNWLKNTVSTNKADFEVLDCQDQKGVEALISKIFKKYQRIDILVNNVGGNVEKRTIEELDDNYVRDVFEQNFYTALNFTREVVPIMRKRKYGRIVNIGSIAGRTYSHFSNAAYVASKAALIGLTKQLAFEEIKHGITINAVCPGPINTDRIKGAWNKKSKNEQMLILNAIPAKRFGEVEEAAEAVMYLCSKNAGYCVGIALDINGGMFI